MITQNKLQAPSLIYPLVVGILLGLLQTGLFFQLTFTLSSTFGTFLLVTVCWLLGSALGVSITTNWRLPIGAFLAATLLAYAACTLLLAIAPFNTTLWPLYAGLIALSGLYPGVFFARMSPLYRAGALFLWENNGFIIGLVCGTLAFMLAGRAALWILPLIAAFLVTVIPQPITQ